MTTTQSKNAAMNHVPPAYKVLEVVPVSKDAEVMKGAILKALHAQKGCPIVVTNGRDNLLFEECGAAWAWEPSPHRPDVWGLYLPSAGCVQNLKSLHGYEVVEDYDAPDSVVLIARKS